MDAVKMPAVTPIALSAQSGLVILNSIYQNSKKLEENYKSFQRKCHLPGDEQMLDCSYLNLEKVVEDFKKIPRPTWLGTIKYRKCLYLHTIKRWRESLMKQDLMTPEMMRGLMELAVLVFRPGKDRTESGAITLQAVLTCEWTERVLSLSTGPRVFAQPWQEKSLGHTLVVSSLTTATRLKQLSLERLATDQLMSAVSSHCPLLTFLNISHSKVTDAGLLMVAGVEAERRPRLARRCKPRSEAVPCSAGGAVRNITVSWRSVPGRGCPRVSHLEAEELLSLDWSRLKKDLQYKDQATVPLDAGFVALLDSLPLTVLNTEVAGRAVLAWSRLMRNLSQTSRRLDLEVLVDSRPSENMLRQVARLCPNLREVRVDWNRFVPNNTPSRDAWLEVLPTIPALESLVSSEIDHRMDYKFQADTFLINNIGARLTKLHLQQLRTLTFSLLRSIKENCSNLEKLALFMTDKFGFEGVLEMEKDDHLQRNSGNLSNLREFHLMGPFPSSVTRYLLDTSPHLETLTLSVDWPESHNFNLLPDRRVDFLGINYLKQVMQGNNLAEVKEVHLLVQQVRGRRFLTKDFAKFVMQHLPSLQHMGSFKGWNMTKRQKKEVRAFQVTRNLPISIDPDIQVGPSSGNFSKIFSENQLNSSCLWLPVDQLPTGMWPDLMAGIFFQLPGPDDPPFIMPPGLDFSDDEEDEIINISSDEEVEENFPAAAAQEQQLLPLPPLPAAQPVNQDQGEEEEEQLPLPVAGPAQEHCNIL